MPKLSKGNTETIPTPPLEENVYFKIIKELLV